ncbi:hypothetical protein M6G53_14370 [Serratia nevei]|uniref:hypothetical protein n=1 Tax=Serratia nevei TaxID=2703794 RepID=UPI0020A0BA47|nr:hypothetical protein [Serratia nevei]MCP1106568.1 hypothetical protein [Serratia nevei]
MPLEVDGSIRGDRGSEPSRWQYASTKPLITLIWQGWNIVGGQVTSIASRGDDPGENLDGWSVKGMSANQQATLQQVNVLFR